jgi:hypothetical protein
MRARVMKNWPLFPGGSRGLSLTQSACDLPDPLVTRHLDPGLACHPQPLAFGIDLSEQGQREIDIHALFGAILPGEVRRDVFPTFGAFCDLLDLHPLARGTFNRFLAHRLVSMSLLSARRGWSS